MASMAPRQRDKSRSRSVISAVAASAKASAPASCATACVLAFSSTALANPSESQLFDGALAPGDPTANTFGSPQAAYDGTVANGYYNKIRPAPPAARVTPPATSRPTRSMRP